MTSPGRSEVGLGCKVTEGGKRGRGGEDETAKVYDESRRLRTETRESHCATAKTGIKDESHCAIMTTKTGGGPHCVIAKTNEGRTARQRELRLELGLGSHCAIANETSPHCAGIYNSKELAKVRETSLREISTN